jgi:Protein of unknown function (DUF551)
MNWLPIDTAPKDGSVIIAIAANAPTPESGAVAWHELFEGCGYWKCGDPWGSDVEFPEPTHWMPMPTITLAYDGRRG